MHFQKGLLPMCCDFIMAIEIIFFGGGEKYCRYRQHLELCKTVEKSAEANTAKTISSQACLGPGKGLSDLQNLTYIHFVVIPTRPPGGSKNMILWGLANMRYIT